jgi:hypothetical protein
VNLFINKTRSRILKVSFWELGGVEPGVYSVSMLIELAFYVLLFVRAARQFILATSSSQANPSRYLVWNAWPNTHPSVLTYSNPSCPSGNLSSCSTNFNFSIATRGWLTVWKQAVPEDILPVNESPLITKITSMMIHVAIHSSSRRFSIYFD